MKKTFILFTACLLLLLTVGCAFTPQDSPTPSDASSDAEEPTLSSDASLSSVTVNGQELIGRTEELHFDHTVTTVHISVRTSDANATADESERDIDLDFGINSFSVTVTAEDGTTKKTTFSVYRDKNGNNALASVSVDGQKLDIDNLLFSVPYEVTSVTVRATAESSDAVIGFPEEPIALEQGNNNVALTVTAQNGDVKEYVLTVSRAEYVPSSNAALSALSLTNASLDAAFNADTLQYTATTKYKSTTSVTVNAKPADAKAKITVTGPDKLVTGNNVFTVKVTAEDKTTTKTYQITIYKAPVWPYAYDGTYGLDITNKTDLVSICYSVWFDFVNTRNTFTPDSTNTISQLEKSLAWNSEPETFYYWGEPDLGFYKSTDRSVIRTHMTQLAEAGIDFIIIDNTNIPIGWTTVPCTENIGGLNRWDVFITNPITALLEECVKMRSEGLKTPNVVLWNRGEKSCGYWQTTQWTYTWFFCNEKYKDLWVYQDGKPLFLLTLSDSSMSVAMQTIGVLQDKITARKMWGFQTPTANDWTFLQRDNSVRCSSGEQMCVCVAVQRTYMSTTSTARGRNHGLTFYSQWADAFKYRPKIVTLTWWNEWVAQRQSNGQFVDNYNQEYSRDIEPMKGGHGDQYYQWMIRYIRAYKNHETCPRLVEAGY